MRNALRWMVIVGLAAVLAWSGLAKVADPVAFVSAIRGFRIVDGGAAWVLAYYLPWLELVIAVALLVPRYARGAMLLALVLFVGFAVLWGVTLVRGLDPQCGCFGSGGEASTVSSLMRAIGLALLALWALWLGAPAPRR